MAAMTPDQTNKPYTAAEVADRLGHGTDWLYRHYRTLVAHHGMPAALVPIGHYRFRRRDIDAWLTARKNPAFDQAPANDLLPPLSLDDERAALAAEYGGSR
jgi:excisionase family DNA binding protein